ncbi:hypothetical protein V8E51_011455 [Hyaloscypha variabilis]|jgi:hypothetical protein|uniref:F-box domain-containing protein n=1 Tax=Hyaloscypha variabilis (strain UAMH 11265 / GT02V1 / F) TaxID=1149755 RepID=A0A2J6RY87_HYAVF|nr:hypothetical protein L207DRAFT_509995 [Hyaloscypha variabilis F]
MPWFGSFGSSKKHKSKPKRSSRRSHRPVEYDDQPTYSSYPTPQYSTGYRSHHYEPAPSSRPYLTSLPAELKYNIVENLDPVSSACLGLSSKTWYPYHKKSHRKVGLFESSRDHPLPLCFSMRVPANLVLDWESEKFVTRERLAELESKRRKESRAYWDAKKRTYEEYDGRRGYERGYERSHEPRYERGYDRGHESKSHSRRR